MISFAGDLPALTTGPRLALHAASSSMPTRLAPEAPADSENRSLKALRAALAPAQLVDRGLPLTFGPNDAGQDLPELLVTLLIFKNGSTVLTPSDAVNVLSISANVVTDDELAQLALQAADNGLVLDGVVVVNPDPSDNTTGLRESDAVGLLLSGAGAGAGAGADVGDHDVICLEARTGEAAAWPGRVPSRQR